MPTNLSPMPPMQSTSRGSGHKKASASLIILAVAVLALIIWWVSQAPEMEETATPTTTPTPAVQDELLQEADELDLGDIDSEFQQIDQELNTL
ncbi:MAG: hypothetical protein Q8R34_01655 [bacterium]|nr:hypothetical protein [bacterium]